MVWWYNEVRLMRYWELLSLKPSFFFFLISNISVQRNEKKMVCCVVLRCQIKGLIFKALFSVGWNWFCCDFGHFQWCNWASGHAWHQKQIMILWFLKRERERAPEKYCPWLLTAFMLIWWQNDFLHIILDLFFRKKKKKIRWGATGALLIIQAAWLLVSVNMGTKMKSEALSCIQFSECVPAFVTCCGHRSAPGTQSSSVPL